MGLRKSRRGGNEMATRAEMDAFLALLRKGAPREVARTSVPGITPPLNQPVEEPPIPPPPVERPTKPFRWGWQPSTSGLSTTLPGLTPEITPSRLQPEPGEVALTEDELEAEYKKFVRNLPADLRYSAQRLPKKTVRIGPTKPYYGPTYKSVVDWANAKFEPGFIAYLQTIPGGIEGLRAVGAIRQPSPIPSPVAPGGVSTLGVTTPSAPGTMTPEDQAEAEGVAKGGGGPPPAEPTIPPPTEPTIPPPTKPRIIYDEETNTYWIEIPGEPYWDADSGNYVVPESTWKQVKPGGMSEYEKESLGLQGKTLDYTRERDDADRRAKEAEAKADRAANTANVELATKLRAEAEAAAAGAKRLADIELLDRNLKATADEAERNRLLAVIIEKLNNEAALKRQEASDKAAAAKIKAAAAAAALDREDRQKHEKEQAKLLAEAEAAAAASVRALEYAKLEATTRMGMANLAETTRANRAAEAERQARLTLEQGQWGQMHPGAGTPWMQTALEGGATLSREDYERLLPWQKEAFANAISSRQIPEPWWWKGTRGYTPSPGAGFGGGRGWGAFRQY